MVAEVPREPEKDEDADEVDETSTATATATQPSAANKDIDPKEFIPAEKHMGAKPGYFFAQARTGYCRSPATWVQCLIVSRSALAACSLASLIREHMGWATTGTNMWNPRNNLQLDTRTMLGIQSGTSSIWMSC